MAITADKPIVVPAQAKRTYDTILVLETRSLFDLATSALRYSARVGLGAADGHGGYVVLESSIKTISIPNMWVDGTPAEQGLSLQVVETLKLRYQAM